jgi:hypothetical protein
MKNASHPLNFLRWFDPRSRSISTLGVYPQPVTALGLTLYLFLHLIVLGTAGPGAQGL